MAAGDFTVPDSTGTTSTDLTTLFGVAQGVGETPVKLRPDTTKTELGGFGPGVGSGAPGTRGPSSTVTVPGQSSTVTQTLQAFYGMDRASLQNLQQQLYSGGFFSDSYYGKSPKTPQFGAHDDDSFAAFKSAVVQSARSGKALPAVLSEAMASVAAGGGPGAPAAKPAPATLRPPNPDDIRAVVTRSAKSLLGHRADEATIQRIINGYQAAVVAEQKGVNDAQTTGGTVTQAPDVSSFVGQQLQAAAPVDVATHTGLGVGNLFMQAFLSSPGNAPTGASS